MLGVRSAITVFLVSALCLQGAGALVEALDSNAATGGSPGNSASAVNVMDTCFPSMPLRQLSYQPDHHMQVFWDFAFICGGEIAAWKFYASKTGTFYVSAWRKHSSKIEMIGKNLVEATTEGYQTTIIPKALRFKVQPGDVLGIHYEKKVGDSVISFEDSHHATNLDTSIALSTTKGIDKLYNKGLPLGIQLPIDSLDSRAGARAPALFPVINNNRIRLDGGLHHTEGRAMFFANGLWGSICDPSLGENSNWPATFCKELGYDHVSSVQLAKDIFGNAKGPVSFQNPTCTQANHLFMDECTTGTSTCDHDSDVYIKCGQSVKLANGEDPMEGAAMSYINGTWGTICDSKRKNTRWADVLCHEIGYSHAQKTTKLSKTALAPMSGAINMKNPSCDSRKPYQFGLCAKKGKNCGHSNDMYVKCQRGVRLTGGENPHEGIAKAYRGGKWGTVCMTNIIRDKFPSVFCINAGYDKAELVSFAKDMYSGIGTGHISHKNPVCGPEDAANVDNCGHPEEEDCNHNQDIFVKCAYNDKCKINPCQNKGICITMGNDYKCKCPKGFSGPNCEQNINECESNPCLHNGTCVDQVDGYKCLCGVDFAGVVCQYAAMPKDPVTIASFNRPEDFVFVAPSKKTFTTKNAVLASSSTPFKIVPGLDNVIGTVSIMAINNLEGYYLRDVNGKLALSKKTDEPALASFYPEPSTNHSGNYHFLSAANKDKAISHQNGELVLTRSYHNDQDEDHEHNHELEDSALFYLKSLDAQNTICLFSKGRFNGDSISLTDDDSDLRVHGFDDKMSSFEIFGTAAWQLFQHHDYNGLNVVAPPGKYSNRWVRRHIKTNFVSSVKKIDVKDGIVLWGGTEFNDDYISLATSDKDFSKKMRSYVSSFQIAGPSSWELYSEKDFGGKMVVARPGRFRNEWVVKHLGEKGPRSVKKVEINKGMCGVSSGSQKMVGSSGAEHDVFVVNKEDGSVWLRFGMGNMHANWTYKQVAEGKFDQNIISAEDIGSIKDFSFIGWEVDSDVNLDFTVDKSWHPSNIEVMYLGSKARENLSFKNAFSDRTDVSFAADKSQLQCTGRTIGNKAFPNLCGKNGLPEYGEPSNSLAIIKLHMDPRGVMAYAENTNFDRNAFTWKGSYYYVYAKLAECSTSTGCYKRQEGVSINKSLLRLKASDRPSSFYFGQLRQDVDACEAACKNEPGCVVYTLFKEDSFTGEFAGGCYGVSSILKNDIIQEAGVISGTAMTCGSFVPQYMQHDMWTKNNTGCPCSFDLALKDCACCHQGACQCEHRYKYQCTLCGFSDRCGSPFLNSHTDEYTFEYTNEQLTANGHHYEVPDLCVKECVLTVRGADSEAEIVAAHMTDVNDKRVLSCVADGLEKTKETTVTADGATMKAGGQTISHINLYAFGGVGRMVDLKLKVNKDGCEKVKRDPRYVGCFHVDHEASVNHVNYTVKDRPTFHSTHMTKGLCIQHCWNLGLSYAMLEKGTTCECVDNTPSAGAAYTCDHFCSGDAGQVCGGDTAHAIYRTKLIDHMMMVGAAPGQCSRLGGAKTVTYLFLFTTDAMCNQITGAALTGADNLVKCAIDYCGVNDIVDGGLFIARPNSCGDRKRGEVYLRTTGADCLDMGGNPNLQSNRWGMCKVDICTADRPSSTIYAPSAVMGCPAYRRVARVEVPALASECRASRGTLQDTSIPDTNITTCEFDMCIQDKVRIDPLAEDIYTFAHNNEEIPEGGEHVYTLPEMCVTECLFAFKATTAEKSIAAAQLLGAGNREVGLFCGGEAENDESAQVLSFADKATGVLVSGIRLSAQNHSFIIKSLKLRVNTEGCKADENIVVLYSETNFGGRPKVIRANTADLGSVDFDNKASSIKVYGDMTWEMFENKNFKGPSAVLAAGEYYNMDVLPFGVKELSSIHQSEGFDEFNDATLKEISNARGLVCYKRIIKSTAVFGLPPNGPGSEDRPRIYFFGTFGNDIDQCEHACAAEPQCAAFTLFSSSTQGEMQGYRGMCYGRSFRHDTQLYQADAVSGYVAACTEEDTITMYTSKEFDGAHITVIEDTVNITFSTGPLSAMVTGKDTWRVLTVSNGYIHTYKLTPGEYSDLSITFTGTVFQVSKMHPNTQLYNKQHPLIDLAPVAFNQISRLSKVITKNKATTFNNKTTTTECMTTHEAEVVFVVDASSSVGESNWIKMMTFIAGVTESFELGADKVRVGLMTYSYNPYYEIPLGTHTDNLSLNATILASRYTRGATYTDRALNAACLEAMGKTVVRDGVPRMMITITDGRSRSMTRTKEAARLCRDDGIIMAAVGIKSTVTAELHNIAGDASRVFSINSFDKLDTISDAIKKTTCKAINQGMEIVNMTDHVAITVQGDDSNYFIHEETEFNKKPVALGMESGVIYSSQIFASSSYHEFVANLCRLNHNSGWMTTIGNHTIEHEWIEIDLGKILPIHGVASQGHAIHTSWVTMYKIAISLDGIHFVTFKDTNTSTDLVFIGNTDQNGIKYHCLHRLFGQAIMARVIRFIIVEWHIRISMRTELYGYRDADDSQLIEVLRKDVWTRNVTGCPCYFDASRKHCACCEDGGCQCPNSDHHQCVQCGYPHMCGIPNLRNPINNIDGWTTSLSDCRCTHDPLRTDCACCQSWGCQCGAGNKNQCVNCGHPEHCGLKEHIFGPNRYCRPNTCPRKINTIWEGPAPNGILPGDSNPVITEVVAESLQEASKSLAP